MKIKIHVPLAIIGAFVVGGAASGWAASIGGSFVGRGGGAGAILAPSESAGVVAQTLWNNIDSGDPVVDGASLPLIDSAGDFTAVRIIYDAGDSWNSDGPTATPNDKLMKGIIKANPDPDTAPANNSERMTFVITNLAAGTYNVIVYLSENGANAKAAVTVGAVTYYVLEEASFSGTFTAAASTTLDDYQPANYAQFNSVAPAGNGTITITARKFIDNPQVNDGIGVAGIQIVQVTGPAPAPNTDACSITNQPQSTLAVEGGNATFTVGFQGPCRIQWTKNGTPIPGAINPTLVLTTVLADNGALIRAVVFNNVVTNTSNPATLTVDANTPPVLRQGFLTYERWEGIGNSTGPGGIDVLKSAIFNGPPTFSRFVSGPNVPQTNPDINDFGGRLWGWIKPDVTGEYNLFIRSDDSSQLYINPVNAGSGTNTLPDVNSDIPVAEETTCCGAFEEPGNAATTFTPIYLEANKLYGIVILYKEGGGGDFVQVAWRLTNSPIAAASLQPIPSANCWTMASSAGQRATITTQPQSTLVAEGQTAAFNVGVTTTPVAGIFSVQWMKNGVSIPGAAANPYVTPPTTLADDNSLFSALVYTLVGTLTSAPPAVLDVVSDTNPPVVIGSGALVGSTRVGLTFDEALDPVTGGNPANYLVNGVAATAATVLTNNPVVGGFLVQLTVAAPVTAPLSLTVSGVKDRVNNTMPSTVVNGTVIGLNYTDIGTTNVADLSNPGGPDPNPAALPAVVNVRGPGDIDVLSNGNDYWNNADGFNFLWAPKTNNFDVKVRMAHVQGINNWSAGAIEVREGPPTANGLGWELARHYFCKANYGGQQGPALDGTGAGQNSYEFNCRRAPGDPTLRETGNGGAGQSQGWGGTGTGNMGPVPYPNAWIRIARVRSTDGTSDHLFGYLSTDGVNWDLRQDVDLNDATHAGWLTSDGITPAGPWPSVSYVGLGSTSHTGVGNGNNLNAATGLPWQCWVSYRDFGDFAVVVTPTLSLVRNANGTITLTFTGNLYSSANVVGPYAIMTGATSPLIVNPTAGPAATFYRAGP